MYSAEVVNDEVGYCSLNKIFEEGYDHSMWHNLKIDNSILEEWQYNQNSQTKLRQKLIKNKLFIIL